MRLTYSKDAWANVYNRTLTDAFAETLCWFIKFLPRGWKHNSIFNKFRKLVYTKFCGMTIGERSYIYPDANIICPKHIKIGVDSFINHGALLSAYSEISIGNRVAISYNCAIITETHNPYSEDFEVVLKKVIIEDDVWIGANVTILPGSIIKRGAVIAAGAVVIGEVESFSIYAGIPAKKIKDRK